MRSAVAVIPARYDSSRFPGKPLAILGGKPMIVQVFRAVEQTGLFSRVIVATDDSRIFNTVIEHGGEACMTSSSHRSGTDRIAEVVRDIDFDIVVNVQGDEPFISKEPLEKLLSLFGDESVRVGTLLHDLDDENDLKNPNIVKVAIAKNSDALYFSRSPIPFKAREYRPHYYRHIGVYAYRKDALLRFVGLEPGVLEQTESLEQLRLLENGIPIRTACTDYRGIGIDTPEDLEKAQSRFV